MPGSLTRHQKADLAVQSYKGIEEGAGLAWALKSVTTEMLCMVLRISWKSEKRSKSSWESFMQGDSIVKHVHE